MESSLRKRLINYNHKRWTRIAKALKDFAEDDKDNDLHKVRVEAKQLTALYHFIETSEPGFKSGKPLKPIQKIFRLSGKIRDYRNAQKFCKKYRTESSLLHHEAKKQTHYLKRLKHTYKKYEPEFAILEREANKHLKKIKREQIKNYLAIKKEYLMNSLAQKPANKTLHEVRKRIKELWYLGKLATFERRGIFNTQDLELLDKLQDDIGNWHDISGFRKKVLNGFDGNNKNLPLALISEERRLLRETRGISNQLIKAA